MATYRQILNKVLRVVGEDEVEDIATELDDDYHKLVGSFVNMIKEEVENAIPWRTLWHTENVSVTAGQSSGSISDTNETSQLVRVQNARYGQLLPLVFDVTDTSNPIPLKELSLAEMLYRQSVDSTTGVPYFFALDDTTAATATLRVHPTPTSNRTIRVTLATPQGDLDDDELDTEIYVPKAVVQLGSIWWTLEERGEEQGQSNIFTEERYRSALSAAVARELQEQGNLNLVSV